MKTTKRFKEKYGSYPVVRIHELKGKDIACRMDGNPVAGQIPVKHILEQMKKGRKAFAD